MKWNKKKKFTINELIARKNEDAILGRFTIYEAINILNNKEYMWKKSWAIILRRNNNKFYVLYSNKIRSKTKLFNYIDNRIYWNISSRTKDLKELEETSIIL